MAPASLFLPVYNEEDLLVPNTMKLLGHLGSLGIEHEVIIGSNGSTDRTRELGEDLQRREARVRFFHLPERGPGEALRRAVGIMRHANLISLDMDLSVDLGFVAEALKLLEGCEIVLGSKKLGVENRSLVRRLGSDLFVACSRTFLGLPFDDYSIGAKAYRRPVLERYLPLIGGDTSYVQAVVLAACRDGRKVTQVPTRCQDFRRSRFSLPREGLHRFGRLFQLWWSAGSGSPGRTG